MPEPDPVLVALGHNVRHRREARKLTQEKLAEGAGLDPTYISGIERGLRNPGIKNVVRLARALGIQTAKLVERVDFYRDKSKPRRDVSSNRQLNC